MNDCPNCEYHRKRTQLWREEAYRQAGHPLPEREWVGLTDEDKQDWIKCMPWPPEPAHLMVLIDGIESELKDLNR